MNAVVAPQEEPERPRTVVALGTPFELLRHVVQNNAPIETIEKFMDLQDRWDKNNARKAFVAAMAAFKREPMEILKNKAVGYKTKDGDFVGYMHAELADVVDVVVPKMGLHGLSHRWDVKQADGLITVDCVITHELGHSETVTMFGPPDTSGKKNQIQQIASTVTYLQRYTLLAACGLAAKGADDDGRGGPDGEEAGLSPEARQMARAQAPEQPEKPPCPARVIERNHDLWAEALDKGTTTVDAILATVQSKYTLSDEQKKTVRALGKGAHA
jgi:hypothetical protein